MLHTGLSSCGKPISESLFEEYEKNGIRFMEISVGREQYDTLDLKTISEAAARHQVRLWSYHLPFTPFSRLNIADPVLAESSVSYLRALIERAASFGIDKFVIHPSGEPIKDEDRAEQMKQSMESLSKLSEIARREGAVIAVENLPRTCLGKNSEEIRTLLNADPFLRICFDTNHLLSESHIDFIRSVGSKIITMHVSDYDFIDERHWLPGEGRVDWQTVRDAMLQSGYEGPWLYEVGFEAPSTLIRERALTCADFARNCAEIMNGKAITVLSKPAKNPGILG